MEIEYDPAKSERNIQERGLSFDLVADFDFDTAVIKLDTRRDYGEDRYQAFGLIGRRLYFLAFSLRGNAVRVISLRKANSREVRFYEQETQSSTD
ncbi:BrnT family toxin [Castellaniella hirudinis]|uniref:BrnT family toxin n=1 Tax=Castellaniella hirudinis TaxID=1144617 RepID=UPI0039C3E4BA